MYYTYMVRCADNSIYTGMTNNLEKRINEHINKSKNGAKYPKSPIPYLLGSENIGNKIPFSFIYLLFLSLI